MKTVTIDASRSDNGMAHHTPQLPFHSVQSSNIRGSTSSPGSRKSSCRESDRKMALPAMPMLMKKLVATIWNPMMGKKAKVMRIPSTDRRMSSGSFVKAETAVRGTSSPIRNPTVVTHVAPMLVSFSTRSTRSYCRAPKL